ncbi:DMT family transporter [Aneurinibacillus migulanus]|uniref:Membrane protein n=1 Tax=Aneurinibacillus migulanus TaxID=47500 RepID=A0A0D1XII1_ANEMI|nr:DMT family transporter [Aneurinibacillus migulanus]KIV54066.1 membrane protein [Aneurinibacillus migulanus]KON97665.1 membrane protein [Aneurinibacillus migulanus]MED0894420.1 DMT family transporter [Aneurinibacillus migulanus]MED1617030.1 DMT family transporter [Aneurinibacillus migulanus]SDJ35797.1 EamA domain-containing membrane protein RarD [Aneurinibacillus migulanus]
MKSTLLGSIYLALASSIWGGMYVVVKIVVSVIPPLELVWMRYLVAIVALLMIGFITRQKWKIHKRDFLIIIAIGIIGNAISIVTQEAGTMLTSAQMGAIITSSTPAFMVIFARLILKERLTLKKGISVFLATAGVFLIVGVGHVDFSSKLGGISLLIAALTWAFMSVLVKRVPSDYSQIVVTTYSILVALIVLTPFVLPRLHAINISQLTHPTIWGGILYLGVVSTAGGFLLWNRGLQMLNASSGGLFFFFQPVVGTLLGWLILGEKIGVTFWIGSILILTGVLLVIKEKK